MDFPIYYTPIEVQIIHRRTEIGYSEAEKAIDIIQHVFPNASIHISAPEGVRNLVIQHRSKTVFNRNMGDGYLNPSSVKIFIARLMKAVEKTDINN